MEDDGDRNKLTLDVIQNQVGAAQQSINSLVASDNNEVEAIKKAMKALEDFKSKQFKELRDTFWVHNE